MRVVWCLVALAQLVAVAHGQDDRLPGESRPSSQRVDVTVYQDNERERSFTFEGQTSVTAQVVRDTAQLVLHAAVSVSSLTVRYQGGDVIASSYDQPQDGWDFLVLSLQEQEAEGSLLVLDIIFSANIGNREPGFSRYDYQGRNEQAAVYATQFMPNYARRAMPCYDEPALKARYQLNMRLRPKTYQGYESNTRASYDDELDAQGFRGYYLEQTPPISPYQLSWVLHDMYTSEVTKKRVLGVIQRKAAHQWFGGLVSPSWWNDLWLTEGFVSYFQWIAAALVQPSWQLREAFVVNAVLQAAMPADGAPGSYPLSKSPNISAQRVLLRKRSYVLLVQYYNQGDSLLVMTSGPGASIVWMIENIMGSEPLYRALNKYLTQNIYMDVWEDLFLSALDSESPASSLPEGGSLSSVVQPWLQQSGFPLISVSRNYSDGSAVISQAPYLSQVDAVWPVPIRYTSRSEANYSATAPRLWLLDSELLVPAVAKPDDWLLLNMNVTAGDCPCVLESTVCRLLPGELRRAELGAADSAAAAEPFLVPAVVRAQLLDDAASLAGAGQVLPAPTALQLASYPRLEYGYIPWRAVPGVLRNLELLVDEGAAEDFRHMAILLRYQEQPGEDHTTRILRAIIVSIACNYGEPSCLSSMYEQLQHFIAAPGNSSNQVGPDLKRVVYCYGAQRGGENAYNFLMDLYQTTEIVSELNDIVLGVTCLQVVDGLRTLLEVSQTVSLLLELTATGAKGGFRREHLQWLLEGLLQRRHTLPSALQFLSRGVNLLSRPDEKQAARKLLRLATLEMRDEQMLDKVLQAAVALEDESLVAFAKWRRDVIANRAAACRAAARWLTRKSWHL
ncbi:aminopeptidase N-like [Schistocerca gregaria]|uniref:aminopeptidase N-like n=1 Tax=Schistocerca gregaria TaxID=7010 RepID=UPI00211E3A8D|nr:aminopeptidase N-like [Schistocerca gregaria]